MQADPLLQMRLSHIMKKTCDEEGHRNPCAPWEFNLAEVDPRTGRPTVRTVGVQRISEKGLDYMVLKQPIGAKVATPKEVAISRQDGVYPPPAGSVCEQWRAEGLAVSIPVEFVMGTAPPGSFAQLLVCAEEKRALPQPNDPTGKRPSLEESARESFVKRVQAMKKKLEAGEVSVAQVREAVVVYRLCPRRMEVIVSGPIWERFEWVNTNENEDVGEKDYVFAWSAPRRLIPY